MEGGENGNDTGHKEIVKEVYRSTRNWAFILLKNLLAIGINTIFIQLHSRK